MWVPQCDANKSPHFARKNYCHYADWSFKTAHQLYRPGEQLHQLKKRNPGIPARSGEEEG